MNEDRGTMTHEALEALAAAVYAIHDTLHAACEAVAGDETIKIKHVRDVLTSMLSGPLREAALKALR